MLEYAFTVRKTFHVRADVTFFLFNNFIHDIKG